MSSVQPQVDALHKLEAQNKTLTEQNKALMGQLELALSNVQRLEKTRTLQQSQLNRLEMHSRGLEVTVATLGNFINNLIVDKVDVEIPDEVRRILAQITISERRKSDVRPQNNLLRMFQHATHPDKHMVKSLSTGKITLPVDFDQNMIRSNSLNTNTLKQNQTTQQKVSNFFSTSHNNILQQRLYNNSKIDIHIQDFEKNLNEKNINLPLDENLEDFSNETSPTHSIDSGVGTPNSPKNTEHHPLSNCDVNFTFNGTRELKNIKSLRNTMQNSSPDILTK